MTERHKIEGPCAHQHKSQLHTLLTRIIKWVNKIIKPSNCGHLCAQSNLAAVYWFKSRLLVIRHSGLYVIVSLCVHYWSIYLKMWCMWVHRLFKSFSYLCIHNSATWRWIFHWPSGTCTYQWFHSLIASLSPCCFALTVLLGGLLMATRPPVLYVWRVMNKPAEGAVAGWIIWCSCRAEEPSKFRLVVWWETDWNLSSEEGVCVCDLRLPQSHRYCKALLVVYNSNICFWLLT